MPKFRYAKTAPIKWYGYFPAAILRRKYSGDFRFHCRYGPCGLNVCITTVSRSPSADSHEKITYVAVLCLLSCVFNCASVSWRFLQSVQRFQFFIQWTGPVYTSLVIFNEHFTSPKFYCKNQAHDASTRYQSDVTTTQHQLHHVPLNISWSVS